MKISVIIPTYRREQLLRECLTDVFRQDGTDYETIVVDQSPSHRPETEEFLRRHAGRIRHVRLRHPSVTAACNAGARLAAGELLVFLDDDVRIPDPRFLATHAACYGDDSIGVVAGRVKDARGGPAHPYDPRSADRWWGWYYTTWDHDQRADVVTAPGANMSCRRSLFVRLGGFDERFTGNAVRFENDFCLRALAAGYRVLFEPTASVLHQYESEGGHDNRHLFGTSDASHHWYENYFRNMTYMTVKHMPVRTWPRVWWKLWRQHVGNRPCCREGWRFVCRRHRAFVRGLRQAFQRSQGIEQHDEPVEQRAA